MSDTRFIKESKNYVSEIAASWYAQAGSIGDDKNISITFLKFVNKIHSNPDGYIGGGATLITEAIAAITLDEKNAVALAHAILNQLSNAEHKE